MWGQQALVDNRAGTTLLHVPYKGSAPAMTDLLGGQVRAIAVASTRRSALLPGYEAGAEAMPTTPEVLCKMLYAEIDKWTKVVRTANIQVD